MWFVGWPAERMVQVQSLAVSGLLFPPVQFCSWSSIMEWEPDQCQFSGKDRQQGKEMYTTLTHRAVTGHYTYSPCCDETLCSLTVLWLELLRSQAWYSKGSVGHGTTVTSWWRNMYTPGTRNRHYRQTIITITKYMGLLEKHQKETGWQNEARLLQHPVSMCQRTCIFKKTKKKIKGFYNQIIKNTMTYWACKQAWGHSLINPSLEKHGLCNSCNISNGRKRHNALEGQAEEEICLNKNDNWTNRLKYLYNRRKKPDSWP